MRGVNKLIVEIKDTENEYFDRAILFLKPDKIITEQAEINRSAQKLLERVRSSGVRQGGGGKRAALIAVSAAVLLLGAVLILLI